MKEIDFLPEWYKSGVQRQIGYRAQYITLAGVFVVMIVWNFITTRSISKAEAELTKMAVRQAEAESASAKLAEVKSEVMRLQKKVESIEDIDSKIDLTSVLAELSFLIDERVVLSKVEFIAEKFVDTQKVKPNPNVSALVRVARRGSGGKDKLPLGDVQFKVVISGVAADASDVAALICKLEDSLYFWRVYPSFSRNTKVKAGPMFARGIPNAQKGVRGLGEDFQVSEFEISCYLANYREE